MVNVPDFGGPDAGGAEGERLPHRRYRKPGSREAGGSWIYQLANVDGDWYLFAFDHLRRRSEGLFRPDYHRGVFGGDFGASGGFELEKLSGQLRRSLTRKRDFDVILRFEEKVADLREKEVADNSQRLVELPGGGVEMHLKLGGLQEVQRWVLGWGGGAVVAPQELADSVRQGGEQILSGAGQ